MHSEGKKSCSFVALLFAAVICDVSQPYVPVESHENSPINT